MKLANALALCLTASMIWNCNEATKPESPSMDDRLPATIDAAVKYAARTAGYQISSEAVYSQSVEFKFSKEQVNALKDAGICDNFISLIQELGRDTTGGPRFAKAIWCLAEEAEMAGANGTSEMKFGFVDKCLCDGSSGGAFFGNFAFTTYAAPVSAGGKVYGTPTIGKTYSAPTVQGYSTPKSAGGKGYSAPSL
ncbi:MAG: hypothetical protein M3Y08_11485 [Fibrobacterota bacterium]|nr:hypothetical protein [Fibrobacterota bacterium]